MRTYKHKLTAALSVVLITALLSACATGPRSAKKHDGAPKITLNSAAIRDAIPKDEPLSKYGNPESYVVLGKRYRTLKSSKGYKQRGVASWYGTKFHGNRTSSGEIYNMFAMTAAHKHLPLPTYVEVVNLDNKRRTVVKVNDRGPFHDNRIIDLSYAAAVKLGVDTAGTANVEIRAIEPRRYSRPAPTRVTKKHQAPARDAQPQAPARTAQPQAPAAAPTAPIAATPAVSTFDSAMYFQIGAFSTRESAENLRQRVVKQIPTPVHINPTQAPDATLYRVRVGPLQSDSEAEKVGALLAMIGVTNLNLIVD